ncbi:MAG TPA: acyl carrier protein [Xanthobacteraceae bacterium]
MKEVVTSHEIRALIADHLGVEVERVTDEAHLADDLGADWLDRLELMIAVEDQFAEVEITDADADQISVVGDLIRYVESVAGETTTAVPGYRRSVTRSMHRMRGLRRSRFAWKAPCSAAAASR